MGDNEQPGPSGLSKFISPKKKRAKKSPLSAAEKQVLINIYKHVEETWPKDQYFYKKDVAEKTAEISGMAVNTIYRVVREYKTSGSSRDPSPYPKRATIFDRLADFEKSGIRRKIHGFFFKNEMPTLDKILVAINQDDSLPNFSRATLARVMKKLNFTFKKRNRKSFLIEKPEIVMWRRRYISQILKMREEGRKIYYLDETWLNEGHTRSKVWHDDSITTTREAHREGLSTGLHSPSGKGKRLIIVHIGNEDGFVEESQLIFESKKSDTDYHSEMTAEVFEKWFKDVLQKLPMGSVVVMDNASYHSRRQERTPTTQWRKADIKNWLRQKNIEFEETSIRVELLELVRREKHRYQSYVTDEMAKSVGKEVLRLPPYHCELNPIEMIWAQMKGYVAARNKTFKMAQIKLLLSESIPTITSQKWKKCVDHVIKEEMKMATLDGVIDEVVDRFVITFTSDSSSSQEESDSE